MPGEVPVGQAGQGQQVLFVFLSLKNLFTPFEGGRGDVCIFPPPLKGAWGDVCNNHPCEGFCSKTLFEF